MYLVGAPAERSRSEGQLGTRNHLLVAVHLIGEGTFKERVSRDGFDFVTLRLLARSHNFPLKYGGVSGGGVWILPLTMDPDKGLTTISYDPPLSAGLVPRSINSCPIPENATLFVTARSPLLCARATHCAQRSHKRHYETIWGLRDYVRPVVYEGARYGWSRTRRL